MLRVFIRSTMAGCVLLASAAFAQQFPTRSITLIIGYPPGGQIDSVGRILQPKLNEALGQSVVVENVSGQGGLLARERLSQSPADGHVLALDYNTTFPADLMPIATLGFIPYALVAHPSTPWQSARDFLEHAQKDSGRLSYGTSGSGSPSDVAMAYLLALRGARATEVPYKGVGPLMTDLLVGNISVAFVPLTDLMTHVDSRRLKLLGISSPRRLPMLPQAQTISEQVGAPYSYERQIILYAPRRISPDVASRIKTAARRALETPEVKDRLWKVGVVANPSADGTPGNEGCPTGQKRCRCVGCVKDSETCPSTTC